jgi:type VI secretion system protein ImpA
MPSPSVLSFDDLLAPLPGDNPAGDSVPFALREKLEAARKEVDPSAFADDDPARPSEPVKADWPGILRLTQEALQATSKDLLLAARLTEALVKQHGFSGLVDGLCLLRRLLDECWDRVLPSIEDGDLEVRAAPFFWLDDPDRGARFPNTLRGIPLLPGTDGPLTWFDWRKTLEPKQEGLREQFDKAVAAAPREFCQNLVEDLERGVAELMALVGVLNARLGQAAPGMTKIHAALTDCLKLAQQVLQRKGPAPVADAGAPADGEEPAGEGAPRAARALTTRADVYQRLTEAADVLAQLEPHSPVPYLIRKAVEFGSLPFPQLMRALIREEQVIAEMNRELGIKEPPPDG